MNKVTDSLMDLSYRLALYVAMLMIFFSAHRAVATEADFVPHVQVTTPYVELRSGPAWGFPVVTVNEKKQWLQILIRKTEWIKVKNKRNETGWINIEDLLLMTDSQGQGVELTEPRFDDFNTRRWEFGLMSGEFDRSALINAYTGYWLTNNISTEVSATQVLSDSAELLLLNASLMHQAFPTWRLSPYFGLGIGKIVVKPKATLSDLDARNEEALNVALGIRYYLNDRYFVRAEVRDYKIFTNRDNNEEATEWKIGLSVFF